ncbi:hypothetical protein M422DRAFT_33941 [Sphaerobolus stellatus SS14]|uniref:Uncharacterized protein n=1 Tax=Sphaerobolus stellatus (strain SS14) TaxID=990650 RepID=A0A0C9VHQ9_SPHS4|nr:hypothetical protein M422DRAFT_33941 [Sphaerobolus stellatus SS14]
MSSAPISRDKISSPAAAYMPSNKTNDSTTRTTSFVSTQPRAETSMRMTTDPNEIEAQNKAMRLRGGCIPCPDGGCCFILPCCC